MIISIKKDAQKNKIDSFIQEWQDKGFEVKALDDKACSVLALFGDTTKLDVELVGSNPIVEKVQRITAPYKLAARETHPENTIVKAGNAVFGAKQIPVIAGPCSVESEEQIIEIAKAVKKAGAVMLRGGAFKPRTSPYSFQGLGKQGLDFLRTAKKETGLSIVSELTDIRQLEYFDDIDMIQIGARNMQNFELLKELGKTGRPVLLKRGMSATVKELLMSAEYLLANGNQNVVLCERGIRTFDNYARNCMDLSIIPYLHKETHLPVIVDPSHASGARYMVSSLSKAAIACNADGLLLEVHSKPEAALSDGAQSLSTEEFTALMKPLCKIAEINERKI